jgi:hypothetical protein
MPSYEERIAALEQKVTDIELERLYEKRQRAESTPSEQAYDAKQVNYRLTMLLGIASGQEHDIKILKGDVSIIKERLGVVEATLNQHTELLNQHTELLNQHTALLNQHTELLTQILARLPEKP